MPFTIMDFVLAAYAVMLLCVIVVELRPAARYARLAALSSLFLACAGGAAWSYVAYHQKAVWPDMVTPAAYGGSSDEVSETVLSGRGGREIDPDAKARGSASGGGAGSAYFSDGGAGRMSRDVRVLVSRYLSLAGREDADDAAFEKDKMIDCADCPQMISVPAGTAMIGAKAEDKQASAVERPQRRVRFWPGFKISAEPISAQSFAAFMSETGRGVWLCGRQVASNKDDGSEASVVSHGAAECVMPGDADAYAQWLSARTGKAFRLPTAAEWEYAARVLPAPGMATGQVAEIVADCFSSAVPKQEETRIAAKTDPVYCNARMLKGASAVEPAAMHRFSARRPISARETRAGIGFRLMRPVDGF